MNENIEEDIREIVEETTKWHKLFESFCFKSKYIIERQSSLLKKLQVENNIIKNERNQLHENNKRLITKLRSRLAPRMSPGAAISGGTCLRDEEQEKEQTEPDTPLSPITGLFSPPKPINSPIFPNLVQHNLGEPEETPPNVGPIPSCLDGIEQIESASLRKTPQKETTQPKFLEQPIQDKETVRTSSTETPKTPKKTPKKRTKSPAKSSKSVLKGMTPKKSKRALQLPPKSPDVKRMKQMKMDFYSPAKNNPAGAASPQKQPVSPSHSSRPTKSPAQSPFKMPKSPRSSQA